MWTALLFLYNCIFSTPRSLTLHGRIMWTAAFPKLTRFPKPAVRLKTYQSVCVFYDPPVIQELSSECPRHTAQDRCVSCHTGWSSTTEDCAPGQRKPHHPTAHSGLPRTRWKPPTQRLVTSAMDTPEKLEVPTIIGKKRFRNGNWTWDIQIADPTWHPLKTFVHKRLARSVAQCRTTRGKIEGSNLQRCNLQGSLSRNTRQRQPFLKDNLRQNDDDNVWTKKKPFRGSDQRRPKQLHNRSFFN